MSNPIYRRPTRARRSAPLWPKPKSKRNALRRAEPRYRRQILRVYPDGQEFDSELRHGVMVYHLGGFSDQDVARLPMPVIPAPNSAVEFMGEYQLPAVA